MAHWRTEHGTEFRIERELIDVTRMSRPSESWRYTDKQGHSHSWFYNGQPMTTYRPEYAYTLDSLAFVVDGIDEDGCSYGHHECAQCGETIHVGTTADTCQQFIPGLVSYFIDDACVSREEYLRRFAQARGL